jgi:hypothetical protein
MAAKKAPKKVGKALKKAKKLDENHSLAPVRRPGWHGGLASVQPGGNWRDGSGHLHSPRARHRAVASSAIASSAIACVGTLAYNARPGDG